MTKIFTRMSSRRSVLRAGLAVVATSVGTVAMAQDDKLAQTVVQYQTMPKDGAKCSACVNFVAPNACKIVAGSINPEGWCVAFAPKES
jgi:hypothetical protein